MDDTGHRTATIPRPRPPETPAGKRSGSGSGGNRRDDGPRLFARRRSRVIMALLAAVVAGSLGASVLILPVKAWLNQREELTNREQELARLEEKNDRLAADVDRLGTDAGVIQAAREELGDVREDEKVFRVVDDPALPVVLPEGWLFPTIGSLLAARTGGAPEAAPVDAEPTADPAAGSDSGG